MIFNNLYISKIWKAPENGCVGHKSIFCKRIGMHISQHMVTFTHGQNS